MPKPSADELVGRLTLADAMLSEVVGDMRKILAYAKWPGTVQAPRAGDTTGKAAEKLETELGHEPALATEAVVSWIAEVRQVADRRNRVVHAIALNQCMKCGEATMFRHPPSGQDVDRSPEALELILDQYDALRAEGLPLEVELSAAVNQRSQFEAKKIANATDEIQNPPQIYPHHVEHLCAPCAGAERGQTVVHVGRAIAVVPTARWDEFRAGRWPP